MNFRKSLPPRASKNAVLSKEAQNLPPSRPRIRKCAEITFGQRRQKTPPPSQHIRQAVNRIFHSPLTLNESIRDLVQQRRDRHSK